MSENATTNVKIEATWKEALNAEFGQAYFQQIVSFLKAAKTEGRTIYPAGSLIFNAFQWTPFDRVKVVILGQDPYHNPGQAMGLSFSVPKGVRVPPSLRNIYQEIENSLGIPAAAHGDLTRWAQQGVLLLNAMLTVEHNQPGSHQKVGWQNFTDAAIRTLSERREHLVFLLWGNFARQKKELIDTSRHLVLESPHPSPFSADRGFFGNNHFQQANDYLQAHDREPIDWAVG